MTTQTTDIRGEMRELAGEFAAAFARGDAAAVAGFYTGDGMLLPPGFDMVQGARDIAAFWQEAMDMGIKNLTLDLLELEQFGGTAFEISNYTMTGAGGEVMDQGKGVVIWKKQDGRWKLHRDIWNSGVVQP